MQIVYNIVHFILICALAPWLIGAGYSMCLFNSELLAMAGLAIVVFSFPVTFLLAVVSWVIWRIFAGEINRAVSCFSGLIVGVVMGFLLSRMLNAENNYFIMLAGMIGGLVGYTEFYLFRSYDKGMDE